MSVAGNSKNAQAGSTASAAAAYRKSLIEKTKSIDFKSHAEPVLEYVDTLAGKVPQLENMETSTGVPKKYILIAAIVLSLLVLATNLFSPLISSIVGLGFPAYASFRAIESRKYEDDTQWLMYWVVFAVFSFLENFISMVLYYVPFYYKAKIVILLALQVPGSPIASGKVYKKYLKPLVKNLSTPAAKDTNKASTVQSTQSVKTQ